MSESARSWSGERVACWVLFFAASALALTLARRPEGPRPEGPRPEGPRPVAAARDELLLLVPAGPRLLVTADAGELARLAGPEILRAGAGQLLGLTELCGFEPLLELRRVAFALSFRSEPGQSDFALLAQTTLQTDRAARCAELVIRRRGGTPARTRVGRFVTVRDSGKPLGEIGIRPDGVFVMSGGGYFREVMRAAEGTAEIDEAASLRARLHQKLRDELGPGQLELTLLADAALPLPGVQAMGFVLEIRRQVQLRGLVYCAPAAACGDARRLIEATLLELGAERDLSGLKALTVRERAGALELAGGLPREQLIPLLSQLVAP